MRESGRGEKAEARNHTHSVIRQQHHRRDTGRTEDASDSPSSAFLLTRRPKSGRAKLLHRGRRDPVERSASDGIGRRGGGSDHRRDTRPEGWSHQSPGASDGASSEFILHVPPLSPLHHHHHHHDHAAAPHYPSDYHQMLHYDSGRNMRANNVSLMVMRWSPPAVRVSWHFNESEHGVDMHTKIIPKKLEAFRLTYHPTNSR